MPREPTHKLTFPCLEIADGEIMFETDDLIKYFADKHNIDTESDAEVFGFRYYLNGVGARYSKLQRRLGFKTALAIANAPNDESAAAVIDQL